MSDIARRFAREFNPTAIAVIADHAELLADIAGVCADSKGYFSPNAAEERSVAERFQHIADILRADILRQMENDNENT